MQFTHRDGVFYATHVSKSKQSRFYVEVYLHGNGAGKGGREILSGRLGLLLQQAMLAVMTSVVPHVPFISILVHVPSSFFFS